MAITTDDEVTQLYCEVEQWDSGSERACLWVSLSTWQISSAADTTIYLYFDAAQADNTAFIGTPGNRTEVWKSICEAVYTMAQNPSGGAGSIKDSTGNGHNGTPVGLGTGDLINAVTIGLALDFDGNDYINIGELPQMTSWLPLEHK